MRLDAGGESPRQTIVLRPSAGRVGGTVDAERAERRAARRRHRHRRRSGLHPHHHQPDDRPDRLVAGHRRPPAGHLHRHVHRRRLRHAGARRRPQPGGSRRAWRSAPPWRRRRRTSPAGSSRRATAPASPARPSRSPARARPARRCTANSPVGAYGFANLPPGAYTITFQRTGSADLTLAITLLPGANPQPDAAIEQPSGISGQVRVNGSAVRRRGAADVPLAAERPGVPVQPADGRGRTDGDGNYAALGIPAGPVHRRPVHQRPDPAAVATGLGQPGPADGERRLRYLHRPSHQRSATDHWPDRHRPCRRRRVDPARVAAGCVDPVRVEHLPNERRDPDPAAAAQGRPGPPPSIACWRRRRRRASACAMVNTGSESLELVLRVAGLDAAGGAPPVARSAGWHPGATLTTALHFALPADTAAGDRSVAVRSTGPRHRRRAGRPAQPVTSRPAACCASARRRASPCAWRAPRSSGGSRASSSPTCTTRACSR